jgi:hypothetical protein
MRYIVANWLVTVMVAVVYITPATAKVNEYTGFGKRLRATAALNECSFQT